MAYIDRQQDNARRTKAIAIVAGIHAVLAYGLITGLGTTMIEKVNKPYEPTIDFTPKPPPPDDIIEPEVREPTSPPILTPLPPLPLPNNNNLNPDLFDPNDVTPNEFTPFANADPGPATPPAQPKVDPKPDPRPSFTPAAPRPVNDQSSWVTTADYPSISIRREEEGRATYTLSIDASGRVQGCEVTRSSGHDRLDRQTCDSVKRRARFEAATDSAGARVAGRFTGNVTWTLPK